jgi:hypothetical protein
LIGPGLLLGAAATEPNGPVYDITLLAGQKYGHADAGLWLDLAGSGTLTVAACVAGFAVARSGDARLVPRLPQDPFAWLVVILGLAGAVALFSQVHGQALLPARGQAFVPGEDLVPLIWSSAMTLAVPAAAAVAVPRRFGVALLAGWIGCGASVLVFYSGFQASPFGYTLLALLLVIIPFARTARPRRPRPRSHVDRGG